MLPEPDRTQGNYHHQTRARGCPAATGRPGRPLPLWPDERVGRNSGRFWWLRSTRLGASMSSGAAAFDTHDWIRQGCGRREPAAPRDLSVGIGMGMRKPKDGYCRGSSRLPQPFHGDPADRIIVATAAWARESSRATAGLWSTAERATWRCFREPGTKAATADAIAAPRTPRWVRRLLRNTASAPTATGAVY
jgi:hypothetical protein